MLDKMKGRYKGQRPSNFDFLYYPLNLWLIVFVKFGLTTSNCIIIIHGNIPLSILIITVAGVKVGSLIAAQPLFL